jgi:hypothetical protein
VIAVYGGRALVTSITTWAQASPALREGKRKRIGALYKLTEIFETSLNPQELLLGKKL